MQNSKTDKPRGEEFDNSQRENSDQKRTTRKDVKLKCFYTNANSLVGKMVELRQKAQGLDVIGILETWATAHINDAELANY